MDALLTHSSDFLSAKGAALAEEYDGNMTITNDEIHLDLFIEDGAKKTLYSELVAHAELERGRAELAGEEASQSAIFFFVVTPGE